MPAARLLRRQIATIAALLFLMIPFQNCTNKNQNFSSTVETNTPTPTPSPTTPIPVVTIPALSPQFKSVALINTDAYVPDAAVNQRVEFILHASGGGDYDFGTRFKAITPIEMGYKDNMPFEFSVMNAAAYQAPPFMSVMPRDYINLEDTTRLETWWFGYSHAAPTGAADQTVYAHNYTELRLDALYEWFFRNYPQANPRKVTLSGQSM